MLYNDTTHKIRDTFNKNIEDRNKINSKAKSTLELKPHIKHNVQHFETDWINLTNKDYPQSQDNVGFRKYSASGTIDISNNIKINTNLTDNFKIDIIPIIKCNKPNKNLLVGSRNVYDYAGTRLTYYAGFVPPLETNYFYFNDYELTEPFISQIVGSNISASSDFITLTYSVSVYNEGNDTESDNIILGTDNYYYIDKEYSTPPGGSPVTGTPPATWSLGREASVQLYLPELLTVQVKFLYNLYAIK